MAENAGTLEEEQREKLMKSAEALRDALMRLVENRPSGSSGAA